MMTLHSQLIALAVVAYFLGSVPFGLIVGKLKGIDVREHGSKNIGATNVGRLLGMKFFYLVMLLDALKSLVPLVVASVLVHRLPESERTASVHALWLFTGVAALLGHIFPVFLGFKGGKGVATGAGLVLGLFPYFTVPGFLVIVLFVLVVWIWRYISLGSITAAVAFPLLYLGIGLSLGWPVFGAQWPLLLAATLIALMVVFRHRGNIQRLRAGTERKFGQRESPG
jgi:glycerol-3-phosphate acyltransferase PlsY